MLRTALALTLAVSAPRLAHAEDTLYTCKPASAGTKLTVSFAPESSLQDLAVWVMGFSCKNIVFSADVAKHATKVTLLAPRPLTPKQAEQLFVDAVESTGLVVQRKRDTIVIKLGPNMPKGCPDVAATSGLNPGVVSSVPVQDPPDTSAEDLQADLDAGIRRISDTHVELRRDLVDKILANPMAIAKGARVVPAIKDGKPDGFKLYAIRPSSIYARLGFANGDTIRSINGFDLTSADKALEIYSKLREAKSLEIDIVRRGKPLVLRITIK